MAEKRLKCLICNCKLPLPPVQQLDVIKSDVSFSTGNKSSTFSSSSSLINQHVHTFFILKTIFQLPSTRLTKYLKNSPNVEDWINLCPKCKQVISDCHSIYSDLLKIQRKLLAARLNIINLVKSSYSGNYSCDDEDDYQFGRSFPDFNVSQDCRDFIFKRKYTEIQDNPFIIGDNEALNKLLTNLSSQVKQEEDEEHPVGIRIQEVVVSEFPEEQILYLTNEGDDIDLLQLNFESVSEQVPFSNVDEDDDDWQPQEDSSSDSDPIAGSDLDSDFEYSPASARKQFKRRKITRLGRSSSTKAVPIGQFLNQKPKKKTEDPLQTGARVSSSRASKRPKTKTSLYHSSITSSKNKCSICHQCHPGSFSLRRHLALHHNLGFQKRYPCNFPTCSTAFQDIHKLSLHKSTKHDKQSLYKCRHCGKEFSHVKSRKSHEDLHKSDPSKLSPPHQNSISSTHPPPKPFQCSICHRRLKTRTSLRRHLNAVHNQYTSRQKILQTNPKPTPHHCPLCPSKFTLIKNLDRHIQTVHDQNSRRGKLLSSSPTLQNPTPHQCTLCPSKFNLHSNLHHHLLQIHNQKVTPPKKPPKSTTPLPCPHCPAKFLHLQNLHRHRTHFHSQEYPVEKSYECTLCPRKFSNHGNLRKHCRMLHKLELEVPPKSTATCETCGFVFKNKDSMKSHQRNSPRCRPLHFKDDPMVKDTSCVCELCGMKFTKKQALQKHIAHVHEKKYDYVCDKCPGAAGKGFMKKSDYLNHLLFKHGEGKLEDVKKWLCPEEGCGKREETEKELEYHMNEHKGIKRFTCETCGKGFYRPNYLRVHKKKVHDYSGEKLKCEVCNKEFKMKGSLKIHLKRFHGNDGNNEKKKLKKELND